MGILYTIKPNNFWLLQFPTQCCLSENVMFESFGCSKVFDSAVVKFIISQNLKIVKILDNNRSKIYKALRSEDMENENLSEFLSGFLSRSMKKIFPRWNSFALLITCAFV